MRLVLRSDFPSVCNFYFYFPSSVYCFFGFKPERCFSIPFGIVLMIYNWDLFYFFYFYKSGFKLRNIEL